MGKGKRKGDGEKKREGVMERCGWSVVQFVYFTQTPEGPNGGKIQPGVMLTKWYALGLDFNSWEERVPFCNLSAQREHLLLICRWHCMCQRSQVCVQGMWTG